VLDRQSDARLEARGCFAVPSISYFCDPRMPGKATILFPSLYFVTRFSAFGLAVSYGERIGWVKGFGMG